MLRGISDTVHEMWRSIGLLILRVGVGGMMLYGHGWPKLMNFSDLAQQFPDPFGVGPQASLALATAAEFLCSILVILGLLTRVTAIPLVATMVTALVFVHGGDPWKDKELAIVYLIPFAALVFTGAGRYSLDGLIWRRMWEKK